jgi:hypothetical protein
MCFLLIWYLYYYTDIGVMRIIAELTIRSTQKLVKTIAGTQRTIVTSSNPIVHFAVGFVNGYVGLFIIDRVIKYFRQEVPTQIHLRTINE